MTQGGDEGMWSRWEVVGKGSGDEGKWWWRGVVRKGGGDDGKWWGREVVTKGSGDEGEWWGREVVTMGSGEEGKWWRREMVMKGSGEEGRWWRWEVVRNGSGEEGKWWWRGVVRKGGGDDGKWWGTEVVRKGSGDGGKWWRREVVRKGSGDDAKWWRRDVVRKGSGDEGKWRGREVVTMRSGDDGMWWGREVVMKGSGDEGEWWGREVGTWEFYAFPEAVVADRIGMAAWMLRGLCFGEEAGARNLVFFRVKWLQPAMKGTSSVRRVRLGSFHARIVPPMCFATSGCSCVRSSMRFLNLWLHDRIGMAAWMLHGLCFGEEAGARNLVFFRLKWLQPAMKGTSSVRRVRLGSFHARIVPPMCFATSGCSCVRSSMRFLNLWLHDRIGMAAWMLHGLCFGEEAGARNLVFFRVKWLQPPKKGTSSVRRVRLGSFHARIVPPMCFATSGCSCVRSSMRFLNLWLHDRIGMAAWMLHGLCFGEEAGARNLVFFRLKWLQPAMKGTSSVRRVRLGSFHARIVPPMCFATSGCSCVRSSMRFLNLWLHDRIGMAAWMLHGLCFGEEAGARNLVFFRVKWLQPAKKGTSSVRRVRLGSFHARIVPPMFCNEWLFLCA